MLKTNSILDISPNTYTLSHEKLYNNKYDYLKKIKDYNYIFDYSENKSSLSKINLNKYNNKKLINLFKIKPHIFSTKFLCCVFSNKFKYHDFYYFLTNENIFYFLFLQLIIHDKNILQYFDNNLKINDLLNLLQIFKIIEKNTIYNDIKFKKNDCNLFIYKYKSSLNLKVIEYLKIYIQYHYFNLY